MLTGTPTAAGTGTFTATVTDANGVSTSKSFDLTVRAAPSITNTTLADGYAGSSYAVSLAATGGKSPFTWQVTTGTLPAGLSLSTGGAISGTPTAAGNSTFTVTATDANDVVATRSLTLTVHAALQVSTSALADGYQGSSYSASLDATGGKTGYSWTVSNGSLPAGITLQASGALAGTPTATGTSTVTFTVADANGITASRSLTLTVYAPPTVAAATLPNAYVGTAYEQSLTATGGKSPFTWQVTTGTLPAGLSLSTGGAITGTPTASGTSTFSVTVTDANGTTGTSSVSLTVRAALAISTATLPDGYLTSAYNQTLAATGGLGPYTWSVTAGALPAGLALAAGTGAITGTPTASGTSAFTVQARDANGVTVTSGLSIEVFARPAISSATPLPDAYKDVAYSQQLAHTGGKAPLTWTVSAGTLPAGLSLSASGQIGGTPTAVSNNGFTIQISDANGITATKAFTLAVLDGFFITSTSIDDGYVGSAFTQTLAASGGLAPYSWRVSSGTLPAGLTLSTTGALTGTPTATSSSTFTIEVRDGNDTASTKTFTQTVYAAPAITTTTLADAYRLESYNAALAATGGKSPFTWSSTALPAGLTISATTGAISGTPSASAGNHNFSVKATDANGTEVTRSLTLALYGQLQVTGTDTLEGHVGSAFSAAHTAAGGKAPITWSVDGTLPAGLSISSTTGTIGGTPTAAGASTIGVTATDANGRQLTLSNIGITIYAAPAVTTASPLAQGWANVAYTAANSATGGKAPFTWSLQAGSTLPAGLALASATGAISGTPTIAGTSTFTVVATDALGKTASKALGLTIGAALSISTTALDDGYRGASYLRSLEAAGGREPFVWSLASGTLPPGLALDANTGRISGTATATGTSSFVVRVTDANSSAVTRSLSLTIHEPVLIDPLVFADGYVGADYDAALTATGGKPPFTWTVSSGSLPQGLAIDNGGQRLSGTPTAAGTASFSLTVTDANGLPNSRAFSLTVLPALALTTSSLADGYAGEDYSATLASTGGKAPVTFSVATGTLPSGLTLATDGALTGRLLSNASSATFTIQAKDDNGVTVSRQLTLAVYRMPTIAAPTTLPDALAGVRYSQAFTIADGKAPISWSANGLPSGLSMTTGGTITGTPAQTAVRINPPYAITVTARDANDRQVSRAYSLVVREPAPLFDGGTAHGPISDGITVFVLDEKGRRLGGVGVRVRRNGVEYTPAKEALTNAAGKVFLTGLGGQSGDTFDVTVNGRGYANTTMAGFNAAVVTVVPRSFPIPLARGATQGVYDPSAGGMVIFGGRGSLVTSTSMFGGAASTGWNDTVVLTTPANATWDEAQVNGVPGSPPPLSNAAMAHSNGRTILVGGVSASGVLSNRVWWYDAGTRTWSEGQPLPEAVSHAAVTSDPMSGYFIVFGGVTSNGPSDRMYAIPPNGGGVIQVQRSVFPSPPPSPRSGVAAVSTGGERMVFIGGLTTNGYASNTYQYRQTNGPSGPGEWSMLSTGQFPPRARAGAAYVPSEGSVYLFGGEGQGGVKFNDLWVMSGPLGGWTPVPVFGPSPRSGFAFAFDAARNVLVLFGGEDALGDPLGDTWTFDLSTRTWQQTSAVPAAPGHVVSGILTGMNPSQSGACDVFISGRSGFSAQTWVPCGPGTTASPFSFTVPPGDTVTLTALNYESLAGQKAPVSFVDSGEVVVNGETIVNLAFPATRPPVMPVGGSVTPPPGWPQTPTTVGSAAMSQFRNGFVPFVHHLGFTTLGANLSWAGSYIGPSAGLSMDTTISMSSVVPGACGISATVLHGAVGPATSASLLRLPVDLTPGIEECGSGTVPTASGSEFSFRPPPGASLVNLAIGPHRTAIDWEYTAPNTVDENSVFTVSLPAPSSLAYSRPMPAGQQVGFRVVTFGAGAAFDPNELHLPKLRHDDVTISGARVFQRQ